MLGSVVDRVGANMAFSDEQELIDQIRHDLRMEDDTGVCARVVVPERRCVLLLVFRKHYMHTVKTRTDYFCNEPKVSIHAHQYRGYRSLSFSVRSPYIPLWFVYSAF